MAINKNKMRERLKENVRWLEHRNMHPEGMRLCARCGQIVSATEETWKHPLVVEPPQRYRLLWAHNCYPGATSRESKRRHKKRRPSLAAWHYSDLSRRFAILRKRAKARLQRNS